MHWYQIIIFLKFSNILQANHWKTVLINGKDGGNEHYIENVDIGTAYVELQQHAKKMWWISLEK